MTSGDVNIQIKSIDKISGTDISELAFMTGIVDPGTAILSTNIVPRTDSTGTVTYDVIVTSIETA